MDPEVITYVIGAIGTIGAVWLEIRSRTGFEERLAVLESAVDGLPDKAADLENRIVALETHQNSGYRHPDPAPCDERRSKHTTKERPRCRNCGVYTKETENTK